ncbi:DNA (cytosine-5)-methyltransferase 3A isoform X1 [Cherax quadricarinatus]|uniref:DNA (cytosine-5)-methyltransferase 3A isoform X1 n=1 Tax=Cherax quadricarinatus TaxID=27406 RepID=UPI00387EA313
MSSVGNKMLAHNKNEGHHSTRETVNNPNGVENERLLTISSLPSERVSTSHESHNDSLTLHTLDPSVMYADNLFSFCSGSDSDFSGFQVSGKDAKGKNFSKESFCDDFRKDNPSTSMADSLPHNSQDKGDEQTRFRELRKFANTLEWHQGTKQDTSKRLKSANYSEAERENNSDDDSDSSCEVMLNGTKKDTSRRLRSANYERENDSDDNSNSSCDEMLNAPRILRPKKLISPDVSLISNTDYGRLVWAKMSGFRFWPSVIINCHDCGMEAPSQQSAWVFWFSDNRVSQIPLSKIMDFAKNFASLHMKIYMSPSNSATLECLKEYRHQSKLVPLESQESLMAWANSAFPGAVNFEHNTDLDLSSKVKRCLSRIKKMKLRELTLKDLSSSTSSDESSLEERQNRKKKVSLMQAVREGTHDIETLCIACNRMDCEVVSPHPYFLGGICQSCKEELEDNVMTIGDDGDPKYCAVCGGPGEVLLCDEPQCERVFCTGCIELLVSPDAVQTIMDIDPWYCFLCEPYHPDTHGLIRPRPDWKNKLPSKSRGQKTSNVEDDTPDASTFPRRPLRVLSLFDGIGTGLLVLDRLGLEVEKYYASEVEEAAMNVSHLNFGPRITRVGNVQTLSSKKIAELYPIDLLIGGSPCNDLSAVNPKRKGLYDPTGTGILFFHYYRILKILQAEARAKAIHLFWLFENVSSMPREFMTEISLFFEREPCVIDAKHFSPQRRARYFWGNLPGMYDPIPSHLQENYRLSQYLHKIGDREALVQKVNCITTNTASLRLNLGKVWPIRMNEKGDVPWVTEIEKIFGYPEHYTDAGNLSIKERQVLLGRAWSVPVIMHILKPLGKYFPNKNNHLNAEDNSGVRLKADDKQSAATEDIEHFADSCIDDHLEVDSNSKEHENMLNDIEIIAVMPPQAQTVGKRTPLNKNQENVSDAVAPSMIINQCATQSASESEDEKDSLLQTSLTKHLVTESIAHNITVEKSSNHIKNVLALQSKDCSSRSLPQISKSRPQKVANKSSSKFTFKQNMRSYMLRSNELRTRAAKRAGKIVKPLHLRCKTSLKRILKKKSQSENCKKSGTSGSDKEVRQPPKKKRKIVVGLNKNTTDASDTNERDSCTEHKLVSFNKENLNVSSLDFIVDSDKLIPSSMCIGVNISDECRNFGSDVNDPSEEVLNFVDISGDLDNLESVQPNNGSACLVGNILKENNETNPLIDIEETEDNSHHDIIEVPMENQHRHPILSLTSPEVNLNKCKKNADVAKMKIRNFTESEICAEFNPENENSESVGDNVMSDKSNCVFISIDMKSWCIVDEYDADHSGNNSSDPLSDN